jgi:hypothetical protein
LPDTRCYRLVRAASHTTCEGITPRSSLLRAHASDRLPLPAFGTSLYEESLQVVVSPCWRAALPDFIPVHRMQAPGPLPRRALPVRVLDASRKISAARAQIGRSALGSSLPCNFYRGYLSRLQSFDHLQAPTLARPAGCTHPRQRGWPGRLHHAELGWLPAPSCGIATCPIEQVTRPDLHRLEDSLVGCSTWLVPLW